MPRQTRKSLSLFGLKYWFSRCTPWTSYPISITWELVRNRFSGPSSDLLDQKYLGGAQKSVLWSWCLLLFEKHWFKGTISHMPLPSPYPTFQPLVWKPFLMQNKHFLVTACVRMVFSITVREKQPQMLWEFGRVRRWRKTLLVESIALFWKAVRSLRTWDFRVEKRKQERKSRKGWIYTF